MVTGEYRWEVHIKVKEDTFLGCRSFHIRKGLLHITDMPLKPRVSDIGHLTICRKLTLLEIAPRSGKAGESVEAEPTNDRRDVP
jgi:hypothetical protein